jgi:flagellar biosynthesis/type III secretory pathway protein FliH
LSNVQSFASRLHVVYGSAPEPAPVDEVARGYADGLAQAIDEARATRAAEQALFAKRIEALASEARQTHAEWLKSLEAPLAGLATVIAAKVIGAEVSSERVQAWVEGALKEVTNATHCRIRINLAGRDLTVRPVDGMPVEIVDDPSLPLGCVIETDSGTIDARVDTMLAEALEAIREAA